MKPCGLPIAMVAWMQFRSGMPNVAYNTLVENGYPSERAAFLLALWKEGHPGGPEPPPSVALFETWLRSVRSGPVAWGIAEGNFEIHWRPGVPIPCMPRAVRAGSQEYPIVVRVATPAVLQGADAPDRGALWGGLAAAGFAVVTGVFFALTSDKPPAREAWWMREQRGLPPPI